MPGDNNHPNWHVRCVSVPGPDTDLSLHVAFDNARFLFGCGDGTQRAFVQKRLSLKGLNAVFLPNSESRTRGGLPGVLMTAADAGSDRVDVVGPPDTTHYLGTLRTSVMRQVLHPFYSLGDRFVVEPHCTSIYAAPGTAEVVYQSPSITVKAVTLIPSSLRPDTRTETPSEDWDPTLPSFRPSQLSRPNLERWREMIVEDLFGRELRNRPVYKPDPEVSGPSQKQPTNTNIFVFPPNGYINPIRADLRYLLPLPTDAEQATDLVYICQAPDVRGKFDVAKANALRVPNGPARGRLVKGESLEVDDPSAPGGKRTVRPEDCLVGGGPGAVFIMVSCTPDTLPALLSSGEFHAYQPLSRERGETEALKVHMMVHRVPRLIWRDSRYQAWMNLFGPSTQHFIADPEDYANDAFFTSAAWNTVQLSLIDEDVFPFPYVGYGSSRFEADALPPNTSFLVPNLQVKMHPAGQAEVVANHEKDRSMPNNPQAIEAARTEVFESDNMEPYVKACLEARDAVSRDPRSKTPRRFAGDDIVVTTLGTGSALPSKYRNVSATYLDIPDSGGILLDCGEGTLGQLRRRFGPDGMRDIYRDLKMIFISHMHADHHLGLHAILEDRFRQGATSPLYILGPNRVAMGLQETATWQKPASDEALENVRFINAFRTLKEPMIAVEYNQSYNSTLETDEHGIREAGHVSAQGVPAEHIYEDFLNGARRWPLEETVGHSIAVNRAHWSAVYSMIKDLGLKSFYTPPVDHRGRAFGLVLQAQKPADWKIVYSGDTMPCDTLVEAGKNATLLIHEATLEDDKPEVAAAKGHSTFSQAIDVGRRMKARNILLNHFSQRYPKIPKLPAPSPDEEGTVRPVISISFDLMSVKLGEMWKMAHYMPAISELFAESEAEEGDNSAEAVEHDINASVEDEEGLANDGKTSTSSSSASTSAMTATKQGYTKGHGRQAAAARPAIKAKGPTPVKLYANKAEKLAARNLRREAKKRAESEASGASPDGSLEKREGSPLSSGPVAKRPKSDEGLDESQSPKAEPPTLRKDDEKDTGPVKSNEGFEGSQLLKAEPPSSPKVEKKRAQPVKIPFMTQISL